MSALSSTWTAAGPILWMVLTAVVNTIAHFATPTDVDAWAERQPRLAQAAAIVRRFGIEPVAGIQAIYDFFAKNPPPLGHGAAVGRPEPQFVRAPPSGRTDRAFGEIRAIAIVALAGLGACGLFTAAGPPLANLDTCEVEVAREHPGVPFVPFVWFSLRSCGGDAGVVVLDVIEAILRSKDPAVLAYQAEAAATKASPAKLGAVRSQVRSP